MGIVPDQRQHVQDNRPASSTPSYFRSVVGKEASKNQGMYLASASQNIITSKIRSVDNKQTDAEAKKFCVCAPTNHAGSFKCRLHQNSATQKSSSSVLKAKTLGKRHENLKSNTQTWLSRFGRATAASMESEQSADEPYQGSEMQPE